MIKFFRKVRQKLLSENKFSKYLLYAFGEIVLVVIGILIALQISTWNEARKDRLMEKEILMDIRISLTGDIQNMIEPNLEQLRMDIQNMSDIESALQSKDSTNLYQLSRKFKSLMFSKQFNWEITAYKNLENAGANIIKNKALKNNILRIYNTDYPECKNAIKNFSDNLIAFFRPEMRRKFVFDYTLGESAYTPLNYNSLKGDTEFNNTVITAKLNFQNNFNIMVKTKKAVEGVIHLIAKELEDD